MSMIKMTVHQMLKQTRAAGVKTLQFSWADGYVSVPIEKLDRAVEVNVGEDVDEHTRLDWLDVIKDWLKRMREGSVEDQIVGHIVWCLNLSREWEDYATRTIHTAVAEALLRKEKTE